MEGVKTEDDFRNFLEEFKSWCLSEEAEKLRKEHTQQAIETLMPKM